MRVCLKTTDREFARHSCEVLWEFSGLRDETRYEGRDDPYISLLTGPFGSPIITLSFPQASATGL